MNWIFAVGGAWLAAPFFFSLLIVVYGAMAFPLRKQSLMLWLLLWDSKEEEMAAFRTEFTRLWARHSIGLAVPPLTFFDRLRWPLFWRSARLHAKALRATLNDYVALQLEEDLPSAIEWDDEGFGRVGQLVIFIARTRDFDNVYELREAPFERENEVGAYFRFHEVRAAAEERLRQIVWGEDVAPGLGMKKGRTAKRELHS